MDILCYILGIINSYDIQMYAELGFCSNLYKVIGSHNMTYKCYAEIIST